MSKTIVIKRLLVTSLFLSTLGTTGILLHFSHQSNQLVEVDASAESYWGNASISNDGETLMEYLKTRISSGGVRTLNYGELWDAYKTSDIVPGTTNKIWDMYAGYPFTVVSGQCGSYKKETDCYNREHSVPKSWFGATGSGYSDLVHLVPTDGKVNGLRGNQPFGEVATASYTYSFPARNDGNGDSYQVAGESKMGTAKSFGGTTPSVKIFEPDDQYKGDFARIYYYFATRYQAAPTSTDNGKVMFKNSFPYLTPYSVALLNKWHKQDPVSQKEKDRNNAIEDIQGNRNPYVDHPEWANIVFGATYDQEDDTTASLKVAPGSSIIGVGNILSLTASPQNIDGDKYTWTIVSGSEVVSLTASDANTASVQGLTTGEAIIRCSYGGYTRDVTITVQSDPISEIEPPEGTGSIEITKDNFSALPYPENEATFTHESSGCIIGYEDIANNSGVIQIRKDTGIIYNKTTLGQITSIKIEESSGYHDYLRVGFGNTLVEAQANADSATYSQLLSTTALSGNRSKFFCIVNKEGYYSAVATIAKIIIEYDNSEMTESDSVVIEEKNITLANGDTKELTVAATDIDNVTWETNKPAVVTVSNGVISTVAKGTAVITARCGAAFDTCTVTVEKGMVVITGLDVNPSTLELDVNGTSTDTLSAVFTGSNIEDETVTWYSNNTSAATVSNGGVVTAISVGKAVITATSVTDNSFKATCVVTVVNTGTTSGEWITNSSAYKTALFGSSYNSAGNSTYSNSWSSTNDGFTVNIKNANNNSNGWDYIRFGPKNSTESEGSITTNTAIDKPIGKVSINIVALKNGTVDSIKLYVSNSSSFTSPSVYSFDKTVGEHDVDITSPNENLFYKVEIICTNTTKSNGVVDIGSVKYYDAYQESAVELSPSEIWANDFLGLITCDAQGRSAPSFVEGYGWDYFSNQYSALNTDEKDKLVTADADENGSIIEKAMARYDYIVRKYGYTHFIEGRSIAPSANINSIPFNNTSLIVMVILISVVTSISFSAFIFVKKRKYKK